MSTLNPFGVNSTKRYCSPGAEDLLFHSHWLKPYGSVELIGYKGGDITVSRIATAGHGLKIFPEQPDLDDFVEHLAAKEIDEPFRSVMLQFRIVAPIEVAYSFVYSPDCSVNEYSGRYSVMMDEGYVPSYERILRHVQDEDKAREILSTLKARRRDSYDSYKTLLDRNNLTRELSRCILGSDNYTKFYWKMDLANLARFVRKQRKQHEPDTITRDYLEIIAEMASKCAPLSWTVLMNDGNKVITLTHPRDEDIIDTPLSSPEWELSETRRVTVDSLEEVLFVERSYLDTGAFQVVDYMGDDDTIAEAARVSYGRGTAKASMNKRLLRTLMRSLHTSPFEMVQMDWESRGILFIDPRQAARHRTLRWSTFMGTSNIPLGRTPFMPREEELRFQDDTEKQGRGGLLDEEERRLALHRIENTYMAQDLAVEYLRKAGARPSWVRSGFGVGASTRIWRSGDGNNIAKFLALRLDSHAQREIQEIATLIDEAYGTFLPDTHRAVHDYIIGGVNFSRMELDLIHRRGLITELPFAEDFAEVEAQYIRDHAMKEGLRSQGESIPKDLEERLAIGEEAHERLTRFFEGSRMLVRKRGFPGITLGREATAAAKRLLKLLKK
tara:strand:- start:7915 stop:9750 length:1836 start_codon:yes stop_codon:yes gene_type:complete